MLALCFFRGLPIRDSSGSFVAPKGVALFGSAGAEVSWLVSGGVVAAAGVPDELGDLREFKGSAEC